MHGAGGAVPGGDGSLPALPGSPCLRPSAAVELGQAWPWPPHPAGERELSLELGVRCRSRGRGRGRDSPWAPVPVPHPPRCCRALGWDSAPEQAGSQVGGHTQTHTRSLAPAAQGLPHEPPPPGDWVCHSPRPAGTSPKGGGGSCPTHVPPRSPVVPCRRGDRREPLQLLKGAGKGGDIPGGCWSPDPALAPDAPVPPWPQGLSHSPSGHGLAAARAAGGPVGAAAAAPTQERGDSSQSPELSPERRLPCLCSLPPSPVTGRILPCFGLIHSHPRESVLHPWSVCLSTSLCKESSGQWQSPQPPINLLESSSSGAGSQEGSGEGGRPQPPARGRVRPELGPRAAPRWPPQAPVPVDPSQHHNQPLQNKPHLLHS